MMSRIKNSLIGAVAITFTICSTTVIREMSAFVPQINLRNSHRLQKIPYPSTIPPPTTTRSTETSIFVRPENYTKGSNGDKDSGSSKKIKKLTIAEFSKTLVKDSEKIDGSSASDRRKSKRSRRRTSTPKQTYLYAAQRKALEKSGKIKKSTEDDDDDEEETAAEAAAEAARERLKLEKNSPIGLARKLGMNPAAQFCSEQLNLSVGSVNDQERSITDIGQSQPQILAELRVGGDDDDEDEDGDKKSSGSTTGKFAYIISKPPGWAIIETKKKNNKKNATQQQSRIQQEDDKVDVVVASEAEGLTTDEGEKKKHKKRVKYFDDESGKFEWVEYNELDILSVMTPQEAMAFEEEGGLDSLNMSLNDSNARKAKVVADTVAKNTRYDHGEIESLVEKESINNFYEEEDSNMRRSDEASISSPPFLSTAATAIFSPPSRTSLVSWLKNTKAAEGITVRGGNNWKALAGAVDIDDSGLVLLCPKGKEDSIHVDVADYVVVVGNGNCLAPKGNKKKKGGRTSFKDENKSTLEVISKIRKGRGDDVIISAKVSIPDGSSTCNDVVQLCQREYKNGVRGDPAANPLDRRANRRLVHCSELSVSSLSQDDFVNPTCDVPDDIRILSDRRNHHEFKDGSFLGRRNLRDDESTTAYREINGAADGFPGWLVDRYGQWLLVQHEENAERGPLPSIHDGNTMGVYYFVTNRDRSVMKDVKPVLLEGQPAPDIVEVKENGIAYQISFEDLSTGIFLDQRPQRAWLAKHCTEDTRVLNCFSHCGAFSVAAATAGAQTVNLDLSKKWLDRIEPQMKANGIDDFTERHDCIYGDCFDWLARLAKRGEKYDIVIVDPPSTSVGGKKKKRWSAKKDYDELVFLASKLVKNGGLLWTTTNSATISPVEFARMCEKGLANAGITSAKLERVAPMPIDFPTIGSPPVKNFIWRMP